MKKSIFLCFISILFPQTELHQELLNYLDLLNDNGLEIEFDYNLNHDHFSKEEKCNIKIDNKSKFIFEMGPKTLFFNGNDFRTYDNRTNQLFIQDIDSTILESIYSFLDRKYISSLNIIKNASNSYQIKNNQYDIQIKKNSIHYNVIFENNNMTTILNSIRIKKFEDEINFNKFENSDIFIMDMRGN